MEKEIIERGCFIFKNNKEANFYFKDIKMKVKKNCIVEDETRSILVPDPKANLLKRLFIKLGILLPDYCWYCFRSQNSITGNLEGYDTYYFLDEKIDYMPQLKEIIF